MQSYLGFAEDVPSLDWILDRGGFLLVERPYHRSRRYDYELGRGVVTRDKAWKHWSVPARSCADEIDDRDLELVCSPQSSIVGLVNRSGAICVGKAVFGCFVSVWGPVGRVDGKGSGPPLHRRFIDALLIVEEWDPSSTEREAAVKPTDVRNVLAELSPENCEV
jgi:hypothetical protein